MPARDPGRAGTGRAAPRADDAGGAAPRAAGAAPAAPERAGAAPVVGRKGPPYEAGHPVARVRGIGPSWAEELAERGVRTVGNLLDHLPFRYEDRRRPVPLADLRPGEAATAIGLISSVSRVRTRRRGMEMLTVVLDDGTAAVPIVFFNRSYLGDLLTRGGRLLVHGTPRYGRHGVELHGPDFDLLKEGDDPARVTGWVPVYEKLGPLSPRRVRAAMAEVLDGLAAGVNDGRPGLPDPLPADVAARHGLPARLDALRLAHRPPPETDGDALARRRTPAHRRLAFEEFFFLELGLAIRRERRRRERRATSYALGARAEKDLVGLLPFTPTGAQARALAEIWSDLKEPWPMNRLLLGDVGSGKTAVALVAMMSAVRSGYQAALMAPTEILAQQHASNLQKILLPAGQKVDVLTAGLPAARQRATRERLASGLAKVVVGTHSLISEKVGFARLGLVVIDEQHRFGVVQRADLVGKGERPDVLVMSATPIPRTLALVMYADLDVSILDEKPPGRVPIRTVVRTHEQLPRVLEGLARALAEKRQVYVVRPAVDEVAAGAAGMKAAEQGLQEYRARFPGAAVALVHGRMGPADRQRSLEAFARGEAQILVATTVIEVGIDVRDASVIVVEDADRFGLAQLHQLRGRVGRGDLRSYCVLVASAEAAPEALERLRVLEQTEDGFRIAEKDLELRGPGEFAGTAQSGAPAFQVADLVRHQDLLLAAREEAFRFLERAGEAGVPEALAAETFRRYGEKLRLVEVG